MWPESPGHPKQLPKGETRSSEKTEQVHALKTPQGLHQEQEA